MGDGGTVSLGAVLGGDDSVTDRLIISGVASGTTLVTVVNEGGAGAQTVEGIELIRTAASTEDAFVQKGRIVAGAYDYSLKKGSATGQNLNSWYLTSLTTLPGEGEPPAAPPVDGGPLDPVAPPAGGRSAGAVHVYRPEIGSYASNLVAASSLFNTSLRDRERSGASVDPVTGERRHAWARTAGGRSYGGMSDGQNRYTADRSVLQMGGSVAGGTFSEKDAWRLGIMAGYGSQHGKTRNRLSGYQSRGDIAGYSVGLYGTWYQDAQTHGGLYVDGWALYNRFANTVKGDGLATQTYKSQGVTASVESGYLLPAGSYTTNGGTQNRFYLQPRLQVLWSGVNAADHIERTGTHVKGMGGNNVQTRLGARLSMVSGPGSRDAGQAGAVETFLEASWLHASRQYGVTLDGVSATILGNKNMVELTAGVEGRLSERLSVSANVTRQQGGQGLRDTQGGLSVKLRF